MIIIVSVLIDVGNVDYHHLVLENGIVPPPAHFSNRGNYLGTRSVAAHCSDFCADAVFGRTLVGPVACAAGFRLALKAEALAQLRRPGDQLRLTTAASDFQRGFEKPENR